MSELVLLSRDVFPYRSARIKEESVFSNILRSIFLIVLRREYRSFLQMGQRGARNVKLIQRQNRIYITGSANLENYP